MKIVNSKKYKYKKIKNSMNKKILLKKIENNKEKIKKLGVKKMGLFGSFLKNKQNKKSDVDIIVDFENVTFDNYAEVLILLEKILGRKVDLITSSSLRPELSYIKKEAEYVGL